MRPPNRSPHYAASSLGRLGAWAVRRRGTVVAAWVALLVPPSSAAAPAGEYTADYSTPGSESEAAATLLDQGFPDRSEDQVDVVWTARAGAAEPSVAADVDRVLERASSLPGFVSGASTRAAEISPDGRVGVVRLQLDRRADAVPVESGTALRELAEAAPPGVTMAIGAGFVPGVEEEPALSSEVVGLLVAILVLLVTFGTLVAAGLPIASALFGLGISASLIGVLAAVTDVPDWAPQVGAMIGLGVGIDYALLILTRHRAAMSRGLSVHDAAVEAMATAGRSVLVAGGTVAISLAGLFLMGLPYLYGVALAAMLAVAVVLAASLTLLPAILGVMGRGVDRLRLPGVRAADPDGGGARAAAWARAVQRRPLVAAVATTAILLALTAPVTGLRLGFPDAGNDREGHRPTRRPYDLARQGFGAGANGPLMVVAATPGRRDRERVARFAAGHRAPGPAWRPSRPSRPTRPGTPPCSPSRRQLAAGRGDGGPRSTPCATGRSAASGLSEVHLGGATASTSTRARRPPRACRCSSAGSWSCRSCSCSSAFRAPIVALKAGRMNLLSDRRRLRRRDGPGPGRLGGPARRHRHGHPRGAVHPGDDVRGPLRAEHGLRGVPALADPGGARAAGLHDGGGGRGAGADRAGHHGGRADHGGGVQRLRPEPGGVHQAHRARPATAILVDATLVRMVLVPAVMQLLGERNWWLPGWLDRLLPEARLEGPELVPHAEREREAVAA
jgi:RND superfamily putative drug exporter